MWNKQDAMTGKTPKNNTATASACFVHVHRMCKTVCVLWVLQKATSGLAKDFLIIVSREQK